MGCFQSAEFRINPKVDGQGPEVRELARKLKLEESDIDKFWNSFIKIDKNCTGHVSTDDLHNYHGIEKSKYSEKAFTIMHGSSSGLTKLSFIEYVAIMWNFLSCDVTSLSHFSFVLFDFDNSNALNAMEVSQMVETVYGRKIDHNEKVGIVLRKLDENGDSVITRDEFINFSKRYPLILYPVFTLQEKLRSSVIGNDYWLIQSDNRRKHFSPNETIFDILGLQKTV